MRLSRHFLLSEFLRSTTVPDVAYYKPNARELSNLQALVTLVLEPLREKLGQPIFISGSMRPASVRTADGKSFYEALRAKGYHPSEHSDHEHFVGTDIQFRRGTQQTYQNAYRALQANPYTRQVILYYKTDGDTGDRYIDHIHVSVVVPGFPRLPAERFAFATLDGRRLSEAAV